MKNDKRKGGRHPAPRLRGAPPPGNGESSPGWELGAQKERRGASQTVTTVIRWLGTGLKA